MEQIDTRFVRKIDAVKWYVPFCSKCGLCCIDRDWSIEWLGDKVGICGNLDINTGKCIDDAKKSIKCRTYICKSIDDFIGRRKYILNRQCITANRLVQELMIRKFKHFKDEELKEISCQSQSE
jgi:hypothetical protein